MSSLVTIALPIADRRVSYAFYAGLSFDVPGEPADDGVPEPLQLLLNEGVRVMLIPAGGFGWVLGGRTAASPEQHECVVGLGVPTEGELDELVARAREAGADIVAEPGRQEWGYSGVFADPDGHLWQVVVES